jgi:hypothetical protein
VYDPAERAPEVEISPDELTVIPVLGLVVTNDTVPELFWTVMGPDVKVADDVVDTEPVVGEV